MDLQGGKFLGIISILLTVVVALLAHYILSGATWKKDGAVLAEEKEMEHNTTEGQAGNGTINAEEAGENPEVLRKRLKNRLRNRKRRQKRREAKEIAAVEIDGEGIRFGGHYFQKGDKVSYSKDNKVDWVVNKINFDEIPPSVEIAAEGDRFVNTLWKYLTPVELNPG